MPHSVTWRRSAMTTLLGPVLLAGAAIALSGCNTTAGRGQDISATGQAVTNAAEKAKQSL